MDSAASVLDEPRQGWWCPDCPRTFDTRRGLAIHRGHAHSRRQKRAARFNRVTPREAPPVRIPTFVEPEHRQYIAEYRCGHFTRLDRSWNPVVEDEFVGPYEGYCRECNKLVEIREFVGTRTL